MSADVDSDDPLAVFVRAVLSVGSKKHSEVAQDALNLAVEKSVSQAALKQVQDHPGSSAVSLNPGLAQEITMDLACKIYPMQFFDRQVGEAVGKTNGGRPITVKVMSSMDDSVHFTPRLIKTRPQHLLILKAHRINGFPVFEIVFDGPFEVALEAKYPPSRTSHQVDNEAQDRGIKIQLKHLRRQNEGVQQDDRLQKR